MADWVLVDAQEIIEEKSVTDAGGLVAVYRRRVAHFIYKRKNADPFLWENHNQETNLTGGPTDTRTISYGATISPITKAVEETRTRVDKTNWFLAYTYTPSAMESGE